jgi:type II secretory pathway pseudopilin PulG
MIRRRYKASPIRLPWERESVWLAELLSGRRWWLLIASVLLAGFVVLAYRAADERARTRATRAAIAEAHRAVAAFVAELGRCPHSAVELVHPPKAGAHYLNELPVDGWGRPLYVRCPGEDPRHVAEVISAGPSGSFLLDDHVL